jgi:hypothetical protein
MDTIKRARLHELSGNIAIRLGDGETVYMSVAMARALRTELALAMWQIENGFHYPTTEVTE